MYQFLSASGLVDFETYEEEISADLIIWDVFARKSLSYMNFSHSSLLSLSQIKIDRALVIPSS